MQIPDLKLGASWQDIKTAANSYTWGRFRATANLDNRRQMAVYGSTAQEAESKLRQLIGIAFNRKHSHAVHLGGGRSSRQAQKTAYADVSGFCPDQPPQQY